MRYVSLVDFFKKHGFLFFHIPKNGGTAFLNALDGQNSFVNHYQTAQVAKYIFGEEQLNKIFKLAIIRNPIDRFISTYKYVRLEKSYWHQVGTRTEHPDYKLIKNNTINEAVSILIHSRFKHHYHWQRQVNFIKVKNGYCVNALATQENLATDINYILSQIDRKPLNFKVVNASANKSDSSIVVSAKSKETLLEFYYEDYCLWKELIDYREKMIK